MPWPAYPKGRRSFDDIRILDHIIRPDSGGGVYSYACGMKEKAVGPVKQIFFPGLGIEVLAVYSRIKTKEDELNEFSNEVVIYAGKD